jgi:hypothetical protein
MDSSQYRHRSSDRSLSDRLPLAPSDGSPGNPVGPEPELTKNPMAPASIAMTDMAMTGIAMTEAEAALSAKLSPGQLRAVASWLRAIAPNHEHQPAIEVSHCFRAQASRLDHLARQSSRPDGDVVIGALLSRTLAYLLTANGDCQRQPLGEGDAPPEPCDEAALREAYGCEEFTVVLGTAELAQRFGPRPVGPWV